MPDFVGGSVTLLFTDVEGSTELLVRLGERYAELLDGHAAVLRAAAEDAGGREINCRGEEFFIAFPTARSCLTAAVAAQRALEARQWPEGVELRVRMGIHTGEPAVKDEGYLGLDVHRAARICAAGHGGQILLSETAYDLLRDQEPRTTAFKDLGEHQLKGLPRPERIFQTVVSDLPSEFRPLRIAQPERRLVLGRERTLAEAARAAVARSTRLGDMLSSIRHRPAAPPGFADLGWQVRALLPTAPRSLQGPLAQLGGDLFNAARSVVEVDRFLATLDREGLSRSLKEYREMGVFSKRAAREAEVITGQIDQLERVEESRRAIGRLAEEGAGRVAALEEQMAQDPGSASNRLSEEVGGLGQSIRTATGELDRALEPVRSLAVTHMKLRRTLYRGVYTSGGRYVVPYFDGLGIEQRPKFETLDEARRLALVQRRAERQREFTDGHLPSGYDHPTHSSGSNP